MITEDDVRRLALALPHTTEKPSYGTPGFRVKDKLFARVREPVAPGDCDVVLVWVADAGEKEMLLASDPSKFVTTPHYDGSLGVLVRLDGIDEEEMNELLTDSWLLRAPPKVRAAFEAG